MTKKKVSKVNVVKFCGLLALLLGYCSLSFATTQSNDGTLGGVADTITGSFSSLGKLMMAVAYLGGFGFSIAALFKFKQHKDNPTQIPLGTPIALLVIGITLIFLPGLLKIGGKTAGFETGGGFTGEGVSIVPGVSGSGS